MKKTMKLFLTVLGVGLLFALYFEHTEVNVHAENTDSQLFVQPVEGLHEDTIKGVDVSSLIALEESDVHFIMMKVRRMIYSKFFLKMGLIM